MTSTPPSRSARVAAAALVMVTVLLLVLCAVNPGF